MLPTKGVGKCRHLDAEKEFVETLFRRKKAYKAFKYDSFIIKIIWP